MPTKINLNQIKKAQSNIFDYMTAVKVTDVIGYVGDRVNVRSV